MRIKTHCRCDANFMLDLLKYKLDPYFPIGNYNSITTLISTYAPLYAKNKLTISLRFPDGHSCYANHYL